MAIRVHQRHDARDEHHDQPRIVFVIAIFPTLTIRYDLWVPLHHETTHSNVPHISLHTCGWVSSTDQQHRSARIHGTLVGAQQFICL